MNLPLEFKERMRELLGTEAPAFFREYEKPPRRGLRVNTLKISIDELKKSFPYELVPSGILGEGFLLPQEAEGLGKHPLHVAGAFYLQEPSAMSSQSLLAPVPGMRVLDVCAAPGGKSTGIGARLAGEGLLVSNEIVPSRAKVLAHNIERMGITNAAVTSVHPDALKKALPEWFDAVVVDAPCSGEGMFRKDETAVSEWSKEHVASCAARQKLILESAEGCLAPGGRLVYSTCTFSREENEEVIESFLTRHENYTLLEMHRYYPHTCPGEGHFAALLQKGEGERKKQDAFPYKPCREQAVFDFFAETFEDFVPERLALLPSGSVVLLPKELPKGLSSLGVLTAGIRIGELAKGRLTPSHTIFMAAGTRPRSRIELCDEPERLFRFLAGEVISVSDSLRGYCAVTYRGLTLGFGKAVSGQLKNHLPKGLRLR